MADWLCVDVGFTNTRMTVCRDGVPGPVRQLRTIDAWGDIRKTPVARRDSWVEWLRHRIAAIVDAEPGIAGIALCVPGPVDRHGAIAATTSLWGEADDVLAPDDLARAWGRPVRVVNDLVASAACYGADPALADAETVLVVNVGSGIGSKLYDRRAGGVMLGRGGLDGEIGYTVVDDTPDAAVSVDGTLRGTLGLYASGSGFARMLRRAAADSPATFATSLLRGTVDDLQTVDRVALNAAALAAIAAGDAFTTRVLARSIGYLARALHGVILFAAPDRLVIAGGFAASVGAHYRTTLCAALVPLLRPLYDRCRIDAMVMLGRRDGMDNVIGLARLVDRHVTAA